jgi:hypothetical protein
MGTAYLEDRGVFLQWYQNGSDNTEFWGNAGILFLQRAIAEIKDAGNPVMRPATASKISC